MKEKKNIDRIYQEKFKDFEREPSAKMWENISSKLDKKEKKKPLIIPLWFKIGGVAAVISVIIASLIFTQNNNSINQEPGIVFENQDSIQNQEIEKSNNEGLNKDNTSSEEIAFENNDSEETENTNKTSGSNNIPNSKVNANKAVNGTASEYQKNPATPKRDINNSAIAMEEIDSSKATYEKEKNTIQPERVAKDPSGAIVETEETVIDTTNTKSILEEESNALTDVEKEKERSKEEEKNIEDLNSKKLSLSTFAAPIFYKNIGSGNELSNQLANNSSSSEVTISYGFKVAYQVSKKLKIRTGISKVNINNNIEDISYSPSAMSVGFENINPSGGNLDIRDNTPSNTSESGLPTGGMNFSNSVSASVFTPGELNQQFGYIEVPLEVEFAIIDSKFGLNIIGGGSSLFLDNNRVELITGGGKTDLGEASNINKTSFSTNVGLGMDYNLSKKFSISVEPIFKYQLNAFNNVDNVQPVNFGVYSGLNFKF